MEYLLAMAPPPNGSGGGSSLISTVIMFGAIFLIFYFMIIRPQQKRAKDREKLLSNMQKGDKVVTIAGIHGTVNKVNEDNTIMLEVSPGSYMKIERSAISIEWTQQLNKAAATAAK